MSQRVASQVWNCAVEGLVAVPGCEAAVLYLAPLSSLPPSTPLSSLAAFPPVLASPTAVTFALTGFNPNATTRALALNREANAELARRIASLQSPRPVATWQSFGFHEGERWREDGFCVAFDRAHADRAREAVLGLGHEFGQVAVFEYTPKANDDPDAARVLERAVVECAGGGVTERCDVVRVAWDGGPIGRLDWDWRE